MKKVILFWFLLVTVCYLGFTIPNEKEISNDSGMKDLSSLEILKQDFNDNQGKVRIVTLLSPT
jgi:hypothetical protein